MFFRLKEKCGTHSQNGRTYHPGDVVETNMDLCEKFRTKFVKVFDEEDKKDTGRKTPKIKTPPVPASKKTESDKDNKSKSDSVSKKSKKKTKKKGKKKNSKKYGVNVTEEFPIAEDNELRVYEKVADNGKWYSIIEMDDQNKKVLLKKCRKKDVVNFIEDMIEDEVHDDEEDDEEDDD